MVEGIHTGIRKAASADENLNAVRKAAERYGHGVLVEHLKHMMETYSWIKNDDSCREMVTDLISQLEYDQAFSSDAFEPLIVPSELQEIRSRW